MSKFVLRAYNFGYNDENYFVNGWRIGKTFDNREEAEETYRKLQLQYLSQLNLYEHEYVFDGEDKYLEKISSFIKEKTGKDLSDDVHTEMNDDDLFEFGEFADMRAFKLIEFDDEPVFYALYDPREDAYLRYFDEDVEGPVYGNSQDEVNSLMAEHSYHSDWSARGSLEELSDNPVVLGQLIESAKGINYSRSNRLSINEPAPQDIGALNALLKKPIFEIRELDADGIRKLEDEMMEEMYS